MELNKKYGFVCIYCVDPGFVDNMYYDFIEIISTGFNIIDIECVYGSGRWDEKTYKKFYENLLKINNEIINLSKKGRFIFYESFIEYIRNRTLKFPQCPGYMDLEVYPDGSFGFYPYGFIDLNKVKTKITIGNVEKGIIKKYRECKYPSKRCYDCTLKYYKIKELLDGSYAYQTRNNLSGVLFKRILSLSTNKNYAREYIKELAIAFKYFYNEYEE